MPYQSNAQLPESVTNVLPKHAQDIYRATFNNAFDEYQSAADRQDGDDRETTAHKVAWSAVKKRYQKGDDGQWHAKE
ncbi:MAG: cation transport regulator [Aeromonadales bacterium]|nr:cation transport regulator [Aeromonadales bacterium]